MTIETGIAPNRTPHTLADVRATTGEYFSAGVEDVRLNNPASSEIRSIERQSARYALPLEIDSELQALDLQERERDLAQAGSTQRPDRREVPMLTADEANQTYGPLGLKFDAPIASREAELLAETKKRELAAAATFRAARASAFDGGGLGVGRAGISLATDFLGSALDPINFAAAFLPIVGPAGRVLLTSRLGQIGGSVAAGVVEGAVGNALVEPLIAGSAYAEQRDYSWWDSAANIVLGGVLGGSIGGIGGWLGRGAPSTAAADAPNRPLAPSGGPPAPHGFQTYAAGWRAALEQVGQPVPRELDDWTKAAAWDRQAPMVAALENVSPETRRITGTVATMQYLGGRPIDVEPILRLDPNWRSPAADPIEKLRLLVDQRRVAGLLAGPTGTPESLISSAEAGLAVRRSPTVAVVEGSQSLPLQISTRPPPPGSEASRAKRPSSERTSGANASEEIGAIDRASNRKIVQPSADLNELQALAKAALPQLEASLQTLEASVPGVRFIAARTKEPGNLQDKLARKPQPLNTVPDWLGGRVSVASPAAAQRAVERLADGSRILDIENFLEHPRAGGYRAIHLQMMLPNGLSAEVQLIPTSMLPHQKQAHEIYTKWRSRDLRELTPEQLDEYVRDFAASRQTFDEAYREWAGAADVRRYRDFPPGDLTVDAKRFQFKAGGDGAGVTSRLAGVEQWDQRLAGVSIVWEDLEGRRFVVDGHQRHGLATRLAKQGQDPQIHAIVLREANGESEGYARALAAFKNIAEGSGTAIDAAKILRETRADPNLKADLDSGRLPPLPPTSALVRDAGALARLPDEAFGIVAAGKLEPSHAAHVTRILADPKQQLAAVEMLAKLGPDTAEQARLIVEQIRAAGFREGETVDLFGRQDVAASLMLERAKVLEAAARALKKDAAVFRTLVERENVAAEAGNVLARDANLERLTDDKIALTVLEALANRAGPLSTSLNDAARALSEGRTLRSVSSEFLKAVRAESSALKPQAVRGDLGALAEVDNLRKLASQGDTIGDPAALERQAADAAATPKDLFASPEKLAEAEADRVRLEAEQAIAAHPELKADLEAADRAAGDADLFGRASEALAGCKITGGS